jgi:hypothetical protein
VNRSDRSAARGSHRPRSRSILIPVQFNPSGESTNDDKDIAAVRVGTHIVDVENLERSVRRRNVVVNLNRNAEVVHFLATRALAYEGLDVLANVGPVVNQADELGHGAFGTAMANN